MKLLAFDLDRTCLNSQDLVPDSALDALRRAIAAGVTVVPTTGRNLLAIPAALRSLDGVRYAITSNGAAIHDLATGEILYERTIPVEKAASILERVIAMGIPCSATVRRDVIDMSREVWDFRHTFFHDYAESLFADDLPAYLRERGENAAKLHFLYLGRHDGGPVYDLLDAEPGIFWTGDLTGHTEVVAEGVNKGSGLAKLARLLNIPREETAAIGDSDNDVMMLRFAGVSAAMGGSPNHVLASAKIHTDDCDHDGFANAVDEMLK